MFKDGENALKVFPPLIEIYPESKLNLIIHYIKQNQIEQAYKMIFDIEPVTPKEYIIKAVVLAIYGQKKNNNDSIMKA